MTIDVDCPRCHCPESFTVVVEDSGSGYNATYGVTDYWFRGTGTCSECGYEGEYSDSSL
jgi:predicted nucleic-acid-binding Zn-ribbon protein